MGRGMVFCYGSVLNYQVLLSLVLADLQLFFVDPNFLPFGPAAALVNKNFDISECKFLSPIEFLSPRDTKAL